MCEYVCVCLPPHRAPPLACEWCSLIASVLVHSHPENTDVGPDGFALCNDIRSLTEGPFVCSPRRKLFTNIQRGRNRLLGNEKAKMCFPFPLKPVRLIYWTNIMSLMTKFPLSLESRLFCLQSCTTHSAELWWVSQ